MDYNCLQRTNWYRPAHPVGVAKATPAAWRHYKPCPHPRLLPMLLLWTLWLHCLIQTACMMCGIGGGGGGGGTFLGETPPFGSVWFRLLYIPHPRFTVNTTRICSPAHAACCVSTCRCRTPCIAMKINVRHVCVCVCVWIYVFMHTHIHTCITHTHTHIHVHVYAHCRVCVYLCMVVTSWSLSQHHWGFQALSFWHSPLPLSMWCSLTPQFPMGSSQPAMCKLFPYWGTSSLPPVSHGT